MESTDLKETASISLKIINPLKNINQKVKTKDVLL